jgi:transcriptional regulator
VYVAPVDRGLDEQEWRTFVEAQGFGHLAAAGRGREVPVVVPTQFVLVGDVVLLHVVAANPIVEALAEQPRAVLSVAGDWAFIPSHWKVIGSEDPMMGIPTTYYAAVQLRGAAEVIDDAGAIAEVLRTQLGALQPFVPVADPFDAHGATLRAIRAIRLRVDDVEAKFKFGGNVDAAHRLAVVDRLEARGGPNDHEAANHTRRRLAASDED